MGDVPLDAEQVVAELRALRERKGIAPRSWVPSASFEELIGEPPGDPVEENEHLAWLHANWSFRDVALPEPAATGLSGATERFVHRIVAGMLRPVLERLSDYAGTNARAVDQLSRRLNEVERRQRSLLAAVRHDLIDLGHHVDERLERAGDDGPESSGPPVA